MGISIPLRRLLVIPFVVQVLGITSLVGYLSYRSGQEAVEDLASQLIKEKSDRVIQNLDLYLQSAHLINHLHIAALKSGAVSLEDLDKLHRYLTLQLFQNPAATTYLLGTVQGDLRVSHRVSNEDYGIDTKLAPDDLPFEVAISRPENPSQNWTYSVDASGRPQHYLETIQNIDVRDRPWFQLAVTTQKPGWSEPFQIGTTNNLAINAYTPFFDDANRLQGVFSVNLSLQRITDFLKEISISEHGLMFILDHEGLLIASSTTDPSYLAAKLNPETPLGEQILQPSRFDFRRLAGEESPNPVIRHTAEYLAATAGNPPAGVHHLTIAEQPYFLKVLPYRDDQGLEWQIVTVIPQSDFLTEIQESVLRTILLSGLALLGSISFGVWVTSQVSRSLSELSQAIQTYADQGAATPSRHTAIKEVNILWRSFSRMMAQLDYQQKTLAEFYAGYTRSLEQEVADRTQSLETAAEKLKTAQRIAQVGSWEFDVSTQQMFWSEEMFRLVGLDPQQAVPGTAEIWQISPLEDRERLQAAAEQAINHGVSYEVEHQVRRPDGTTCYVVSRGEAIRNEGGQVVKLMGTSADISDRKTTELALQQLSQELAEWRDRYDIATRAGRQIIFEYNLLTDQYTWGQNGEDILGYAPNEYAKTLEASIQQIHPEDQPRFLSTLQEGHTTFCLELRVRKKDGTYLWMEDQGMLQKDAQGQYVKVIGSLKDISDRKQAEAERDTAMALLQESEAGYFAILENQTELITRFGLDGTLLFVNDAYCKYFGVTKEEAIGQPYQPRVLPEDQIKIERCLANLTLKNSAGTVENRVYANGQVRWMQWTNRAIFDESGSLIEFQAVGRDIQNQKIAEIALRESQAKFQRLVDDIGEKFLVFSYNPHNGIITYVSAGTKSILGFNREALIGKPWAEFINLLPTEREKVQRILVNILAKRKTSQQVELTFIHQNGQQRTLSISQHSVTNSQGDIIAVEGIAEDVTERIREAQSLKNLNAQLQELAATDSLTKLANRRQFLNKLEQEWQRHQREKLSLTLIMADIDHFKAFNDNFGHLAGDRCLVQIAGALAKCVHRSHDVVARYGGEEFVVLLPNTNCEGAIAIAQRIQKEIEELAIPHPASSTALTVTLSLGIAIVDMPTSISPEVALAKADEVLYQAKLSRNTYCLAEIKGR